MTKAGWGDPSTDRPAEINDYFAQPPAAFEAALRARPDQIVIQDILFGHARVRFRIVGTLLAQNAFRPFAHLFVEFDDVPVNLTIDMWDGQITGVGPPPDPPAALVEMERPDDFGVYRVLVGGRHAQMNEGHSVYWSDGMANTMTTWYASGVDSVVGDRSRPLMSMLPNWLPSVGIESLHAGLVAVGDCGALIVGPSGAGKSNTSLACLVGGLDFLSDDHCGLQQGDDGQFVGHSIFSTTRLLLPDLDRFPALSPAAIIEAGLDKALIPLYPTFAPQLRRSVPIRLIVLPRVTPGPNTRAVPASARDAMLKLMQSILLVPGDARVWAFDRLSALAQRVPVFWLETGSDLAQIPAVIRDLLRALPC